jgi:hypothetical protein
MRQIGSDVSIKGWIDVNAGLFPFIVGLSQIIEKKESRKVEEMIERRRRRSLRILRKKRATLTFLASGDKTSEERQKLHGLR